MSLMARSCVGLLVGTAIASLPARLRGQAPISCYTLSYQPDSLTAYAPVRIDLYRTKFRDGQFLVRWQFLPGARAARSLFYTSRGFAEWRQRHDSLALSITFELTGPPSWFVNLGPLLRDVRDGTVYYSSGDYEEPVRGTVRAGRTSCSRSRDSTAAVPAKKSSSL